MKLSYLTNPQQQMCKVCGKKDKFNFDVEDEVWNKIIPMMFRNNVVCLACFDSFASLNNINYSIKSLYFAGEQKTFSFFNF